MTVAMDVVERKAVLNDMDQEKLGLLIGGWRRWWDTQTLRMVDAVTVFVPFGCPDYGEPGYERNAKACVFCALPSAVAEYRAGFYDGTPVPDADLVRLFGPTLDKAFGESGPPHTLMLFNAGSFLAMPPGVQREIIGRVCDSGVQRLVIEARPQLVTPGKLEPLLPDLRATGVALTIRIGIETQDDRLRLRVLGKGTSGRAIRQAAAVMRDHGVEAGGYVLLKPAPGMDPVLARQEAARTIEWVLSPLNAGGLGMQEAHLHPTCVAPGTPIAAAWESGSFTPATLWEVLWVLVMMAPRFAGRLHLMPFKDTPAFTAVPGIENGRGLPEDLSGATHSERAFHAMLDEYRGTMNPNVLRTDGFGELPSWWT